MDNENIQSKDNSHGLCVASCSCCKMETASEIIEKDHCHLITCEKLVHKVETTSDRTTCEKVETTNNEKDHCDQTTYEKLVHIVETTSIEKDHCDQTTYEKLVHKVETTSIEKDHCDQTTCGKLAHKRQHSSKWCPVSDPTPSTCVFLLRVKQCCNTRSCQLAARICDLYAPLQSIAEPLSAGDPKYHYLLKDAAVQVPTDAEVVAVVLDEAPLIVESSSEHVLVVTALEEVEEEKVESLIDKFVTTIDVEPLQKISEEALPTPSPSVIETPQEPANEYPTATETRTSVVSWDVRASKAVRRSTDSQEQVINRAKQEAIQFRMRGADHVLFEKNARQNLLASQSSHSRDRIPSEELSEEYLKSQLEAVGVHDSKHNQKCCANLRKKFKRKKKLGREESSLIWRASVDQEKRKKKMSKVAVVEEQKEEINSMLSKM